MQNKEKGGFAKILNKVSANVIYVSSDGFDVDLSSLASDAPICFARLRFSEDLPVILITQ